MKNKKYLFLTILLVIIVLLVIGIFVAINSNKKDSEENNSTSDNSVFSISNMTLKSTSKNPITKNEIEATNIEIKNNFGELQVITTLKNNSSEEINGFFIQIDFLDHNKNIITSISDNSTSKISPNGELTIENTISGLETGSNIVSAQISYFEKSNIQDNIEGTITELEESVEETFQE